MPDDSTMSRGTLRHSVGGAPLACAHLVVLAMCDAPTSPSSRHLLMEVDEVRFGRGERAAIRSTIDGRRVLQLALPDPRMSSDHGRLIRGPAGWILDDPSSKNGTVVDGDVTRHALIDDGTLIELGRTFLLFSTGAVERSAPLDVLATELDVATPTLATFVGPLAERFAALAALAKAPVSVILRGETGTGKEVIARALHVLSERTGAFVAVNCGALPATLVEAELFGHRRGAFTGATNDRLGLIRSADGGTLFLDEIGELPLRSQAVFLRVLQEREVLPVGGDRPIAADLRVCAATNRDLGVLVERGEFREDLYARLSGFTVVLPPLRERSADFGILLRALLARLPGGDTVRFSPLALRMLIEHSWRQNIRELEKTLLTAATVANRGVIEPSHLLDLTPARSPEPPTAIAEPAKPFVVLRQQALRAAQDEMLREQLIGLLTAHAGNVVAVARALGARRPQIYRWTRRFGIDIDEFRR